MESKSGPELCGVVVNAPPNPAMVADYALVTKNTGIPVAYLEESPKGHPVNIKHYLGVEVRIRDYDIDDSQETFGIPLVQVHKHSLHNLSHAC